MKLLQYLEGLATGTHRELADVMAEVAAAAKTTPLYLKRVAREWQPPGPKFAIRLEQATGGVVRRGDLRPDLWPDNYSVTPDLSLDNSHN